MWNGGFEGGRGGGGGLRIAGIVARLIDGREEKEEEEKFSP